MLGQVIGRFCRTSGKLTRLLPNNCLSRNLGRSASCVGTLSHTRLFTTTRVHSAKRNTKTSITADRIKNREKAARELATETSAFSESFAKLVSAYRMSSDLAKQKTLYGECLKKPLPLRENDVFENYFMDDIVETPLFSEFTDYVNSVKAASKPNLQELFLGFVSQVSGYGKTHLARVFSRHSKALYFKMSDRVLSSIYLQPIKAKIESLKPKIFVTGLKNATAAQYREFTHKSQQAVLVFFLCAINHYSSCFALAKKEFRADKDCIAICAQAFDNGCGTFFLNQVHKAWQAMDDVSVSDLLTQAKKNIEELNIVALFCDEIHSLQELFVGEFCHTGAPTASLSMPWTEASIPLRAEYERYKLDYPNDIVDDKYNHVKDAYGRPTSLTYLFITVLEELGKNGIACVMLTTNESALKYVEGSRASNDRARLLPFELKRTMTEEIQRQRKLIKAYFGIDFYGYLEKAYPDGKEILEGFGSRALYFKQLFEEIVNHAKSAKPSQRQLAHLDNKKKIWNSVNLKCMTYAENYVHGIKHDQSLYYSVIYAAQFHNGHFTSPFKMFAPNAVYIPTEEKVKESGNKVTIKRKLFDWWMLRSIASIVDSKSYTKACLHAHQQATNEGLVGEDLLRMLLLLNKGNSITSLALEGSRFHEKSIARQCLVDVARTGDIDEFGLTALELLQKPKDSLKQRYIKVPDSVKPDGLMLLKIANVHDSYVVSTCQSKNWNKQLGAAHIETSLKSLDPWQFFIRDSNEQILCDGSREEKDWLPLIRVIWAKEFSPDALNQVNEYNTLEKNHDTPIILIPFSKLPPEISAELSLESASSKEPLQSPVETYNPGQPAMRRNFNLLIRDNDD